MITKIQELLENQKVFFGIITSIGILSLAMFILILVIWIYYSGVKRENSKNGTGGDLTRHMLDEANLKDVEVKSSGFYIKYGNFNKKRRTHKLRPGTHDRKSIGTIMEAAQQAYATTIRAAKGKSYGMLFRVPGILRFIGIAFGFGLSTGAIIEAKNQGNGVINLDFSQGLRIGIGVSVLTITFLVAETGRLGLLYKNVPAIIKKAGFTDEEVKSVKRIYFGRLVIAIIQVIIEVIKLMIQIASEGSNKKSQNS